MDDVWTDIDPQKTRELPAWENQFALRNTGLNEQGRRDRLDAAWKAVGGQNPRYLQDTLRGAGFDVYVHEWWEPGSEPVPGVKQCVAPRNPLLYLRREFTGVVFGVDCGELEALCGEDFALCGNSLSPIGYPLVNKIFATVPDEIVLCGEDVAVCSEIDALCANFFAFKDVQQNYIVPNNIDKWPYFLYIGGVNFPDTAEVAAARRDEFEALCLKISPTQQWLGVLVQYT